MFFPASSGPAYEGWLPVVAVGSAALVLGLQAPGPLQRGLSLAPFVWLGRISYGVYLYHWPIYVILDEQRTGLDAPVLVPLQLAVTLAVAQLSYTFVEQPVRRAKRLPFRVTIGGGALATVAVVVLALTVVPKPLGEYYLPDDATVEAVAIDVGAGADEPLTSLTGTAAPSTAPSTAAPPTTVASTAAPVSTAPPASTVPPSTTEPPLPAAGPPRPDRRRRRLHRPRHGHRAARTGRPPTPTSRRSRWSAPPAAASCSAASAARVGSSRRPRAATSGSSRNCPSVSPSCSPTS